MSARRKTPKEKAVHKLYDAVASYVKLNKGIVLVAGGIQCQSWPGDGSYQFTIAVKCTGKPPLFEVSK